MGAPVIDIPSIADNLIPGPDGIWVSRSRGEISYPEEGNQNCLALEEDSFWFAHRNCCIQSVMTNYPPPGTLLDVGGGNGYVALGLQQAGIPVMLLEPGWEGVQNARKRGVNSLVCSTLEDAGFRSGSLPAVGMFDVLEHIQEQEAFLRQVRELLVSGGRLYLTVPAYQLLWSADDDYAGHYRRYTLGSLQRVLNASGFRVVFASYIFFMLPLPSYFLRVIPSRLGLRKEKAWDQYQQEHRAQPGLVGGVLRAMLHWEENRLRSGRSVPFGGSCLVAAERSTGPGL